MLKRFFKKIISISFFLNCWNACLSEVGHQSCLSMDISGVVEPWYEETIMLVLKLFCDVVQFSCFF